MSSAGTTKKVPPVIRTVVPGNRTLDQIYEDEAREIVDEAIENARRRMADYAGEDGREGEAPAQQDQPTIDPETGYEIPNIKWMTADNFTVAGGLEKIEEFIKVISQRKLRLFIAQSFLSQCGSQRFERMLIVFYRRFSHEEHEQYAVETLRSTSIASNVDYDAIQTIKLVPSICNLYEDLKVYQLRKRALRESLLLCVSEASHFFCKYRWTWERDGSWLYCIDFLREEEHPYSWRYRYAVKWSIPTRRRPIPRATASVYVTIEVSKFKPKTFPVEVYYIFETHHLVHRPGRTRFREKWLKDIIESKIQLMGAVEF